MISAGELKCSSDCMLRTRGMKNVCCKEVKTKKPEKNESKCAETLKAMWRNLINGSNHKTSDKTFFIRK